MYKFQFQRKSEFALQLFDAALRSNWKLFNHKFGGWNHSMTKVEFSNAFSSWLERISKNEKPPKSVIAFNVGLFQTEDGFSAHLVGADRYDEADSEWACEESFSPKERYFQIPSGPSRIGKRRTLSLLMPLVDSLNPDPEKRAFWQRRRQLRSGLMAATWNA